MFDPDDNFLKRFLKLNADTEIPSLFALWCGIAGISCVLGRRLWVDMGTYKVFPNLYVVLVAGSGRCRKSTAVGMIERLIHNLDPKPNVLSQMMTPEGLIDSIKVESVNSGKTSEGFVIVDELSTFLNRKTYDSGLASLLIPLFDCKEIFEYRTKGRGIEVISNACLGLLGASTIDWIRNAIPEDAIGGGLTSRMIFVYVENPPPPVAITSYSIEKETLAEELIASLGRLTTLRGEIKLTPAAWEFYKTEYETFYGSSKMYEDKVLSGYASRRHVHLIKLAIAFAASCERIVIDVPDLDGARALLAQSEVSMPRVLNLITSSDKGELLEEVHRRIAKFGKGLTRQELLRVLSHKIDSRELSELIETLVHSGQIKCESRGSTLFYISTRALS